MIFGISLRKFELLKSKNVEDVDIISRWQFGRKRKRKFKTHNILDLSFADFVDLEFYIENEQFYKFSTIFVKKFFWQTIYINELEDIVKEYARQKALLVEDNDFIFNPPQYGEPQKETIGSELRKDFVQRFGNYVVLMDVVQSWDGTGWKEIEKWTVRDFFFWANYLRGQKILENVK